MLEKFFFCLEIALRAGIKLIIMRWAILLTGAHIEETRREVIGLDNRAQF